MIASLIGGLLSRLAGHLSFCVSQFLLDTTRVYVSRGMAGHVGLPDSLHDDLLDGRSHAPRPILRRKLAQEKAEAANRAKSVFLANMSHELRTPLNAILGFSNLMRNDASVSAEQRQTLDIINRSGEHLLGLINNVLDMAKIEAGRTAVENTVFDLHAMMRDIADLMRQRAEAKGLTLTLEMAEGLPRVIVADEGKLRQVVLNLVGNAVKFTSQGGVTLRLASRPLGESHRVTLVIEVEDSGDGIAAEDQQRIFEPFVQLGHKSDQKGTGLGLTITRQFVELMGGVIRVESAPGKGSKFRVEVPVEPVGSCRDRVRRGQGNARGTPGAGPARIPRPDRRRPGGELAVVAPTAGAGGFPGARGRKWRGGRGGVSIVAAAFHLDGLADAGDGRPGGDPPHPRARGRARREDRGAFRFGVQGRA